MNNKKPDFKLPSNVTSLENIEEQKNVKCIHCNSFDTMTIFDEYYLDFTFCYDCNGNFKHPELCDNHTPIYVERITPSGMRLIRKQCLECGELEGKAYKRSLFTSEELKNMPNYNEDMHNIFCDKNHHNDHYAKAYSLFIEKRKSRFFNNHNIYLNSNQWKLKRKHVLSRDRYTCQSCMCAKATEVHHLSYKYWQNEPLYDLISLCHNCHVSITMMDRNNKGEDNEVSQIIHSSI